MTNTENHQNFKFPFLWGVATSAFQIEGHLTNDMTDWENLGHFNENGQTSLYGCAVNHWERWQADLQLLKQLNVNAYRFSMDWGRIQPERNYFDETALAQYDQMVDELIELDIIPMLTLHHFTHPTWFHQSTPWHLPESIEVFFTYAQKLIEIFSDRIKLFITFNEPLVWALAAYGDAKFPPGENNMQLMMKALSHILKAHKKTYEMIKANDAESMVGIAKNFIIFQPQRSWNLLDVGLSQRIHYFYNLMLLNSFKTNRLKIHLPTVLHYDEDIELNDTIDFWGLNYYYRLFVKFQMKPELPFVLNSIHRSGEGMSDLDWEIYSNGLDQILTWLKQTGKPVVITENGIADRSDKKRTEFLKSHLSVVEKTRQKGYPLFGYFHWSLMDNYEWLEGNSARFGLYEVDYTDNYNRLLRKSGEFYSRYIKSHQ